MSTDRVVIYGDFNCPWSYLASRRAAVLATDGVTVDWRAVEHAPWRPSRFSDGGTRFAALRGEMDLVLAELIPGEDLPYSLAGYVPFTKSAVSGFAEAYAAGVGDRVRELLFDAFWMHAFDLGDANLVRSLLVDAVQSGSSPSEPLRTWGYAVDATGGPLTTTAWRLVTGWKRQWRETDKEIVPIVYVDDAEPLLGIDAVQWLGAELVRRGLGSRTVPVSRGAQRRTDRDLPSASWVSQHGHPWVRAYQQAHRPAVFPNAG